MTEALPPERVVLVSSFTLDPVLPTLSFWLEAVGLSPDVKLAPYGQLFQQLLTPGSALRQNQRGANVVSVRLEDLGGNAADVRTRAEELVAAVRTAASAGSSVLLAISPSRELPYAQEIQESITGALEGARGVTLLTPAEVEALYPVESVHDALANKLGHVPYTPTYFVALGTVLARRIHALRSPPRKVLVVDCDHTLWHGLAGEEGVAGVVIDASRKLFQQFLLEQREAGLLICVASKNNEADVLEIFAQRDDMVLRKEHVTAWRINWDPKSVNMQSMAAELNLSTESFVFFDDDAFVCAEVQDACPGLVAYRVPTDDSVQEFLRHLWALDRLRATDEDRARAALYADNARREQLRSDLSIGEFLARLELRVDAHAMREEEIPRVAQLTQRTNQFNLTTRRRTEAEVAALGAAGLECLTVTVTDRFGSYGLVGVVIHARRGDVLDVDTLLLSCRVLGRGVEHQVMHALGERALALGCTEVHVHFAPSAKNAPARRFLDELGPATDAGDGGRVTVRLTASAAAALAFDPEAQGAAVETSAKEDGAPDAPRPPTSRGRALAEAAGALRTVAAIEERIAAARRVQRAEATPIQAPATEDEGALCEVLAAVLDLDRVSIDDDFKRLGGDSMAAMHAAVRARKVGLEIEPNDLLSGRPLADIARAARTRAAPAVAPARTGAGDGALTSQERSVLASLRGTSSVTRLWSQYVAVDALGPLDVARLNEAWDELARTSEALRTRYVKTGSQYVRHVEAQPVVSFTTADWSDSPPAEVDARVEAAFLAQPVDVGALPLVRFGAFRTGPERHRLVLWSHHAVLDGWSFLLVLRELFRLYDARVRGDATPAVAPPSYREYAAWQASQDANEAITFWKKRAGARPKPPPVLTSTAPLKPVARWAAEAASSTLATAELADSLRGSGVTVAAFCAAAWALVAAIQNGTDEGGFWAITSGRRVNMPGIDGVIGYVSAGAPLATRVDPERTVMSWLLELQEELTEGGPYEWVPPAVSQHLGWSIPSMMTNGWLFHGWLPAIEALTALDVTLANASFQAWTPAWMAADVVPSRGELQLRLRYDADRFSAESVRALLALHGKALVALHAGLSSTVGHVRERLVPAPVAT